MKIPVILLFTFLIPCDRGLKIKLSAYCKVQDPLVCPTRCAISKKCVETKLTPLTNQERTWVVDLHNKMRNSTASGTNGGLPASVDMRILSYDKELEFLAECSLKQCEPIPLENLKSYKGEPIGRNIAVLSEQESTEQLFENIIATAWYSIPVLKGKTNVTVKDGKVFISQPNTATRVYWAKTEFVGCAKFNNLFQCNYKPQGDLKNEPAYATEKYGFECIPNTDFAALCGDQRSENTDHFEPAYEYPSGFTGATISLRLVVFMLLVAKLLL